MKTSRATYLQGISLFTPWKIRINVQAQHVPDFGADGVLKFLHEIRNILETEGFKCDQCGDPLDDDEVLGAKQFTFKAKRPARWVIVKFLDASSPNKEMLEQIFDISRLYLPFKDAGESVVTTPECQVAFETKTFSIVANSFDWNNVQDSMDDMIGIETCGLNLRFQNNEAVWHNIFDSIPLRAMIYHIIQWNSRIKLTQHYTNIPMFLLTIDTTSKTPLGMPETLANVLYVLYPKDQRYIWNIHWHKLTPSQQRTARPIIKSTSTTFADGTPVQMLREESRFEQFLLQSIDSPQMPRTCVDIVSAEMEQDLNEYLREDEDHIVFLFPLKTQEQPAAACYDRSLLSQAPVFYECLIEDILNPLNSVRLATSYFRLDVREFPIYVSQDNFAYLLDSRTQYFIVTETPRKLSFTVSKSVQEAKSNWVSADHCQAGSDKVVSMVVGLDAETVQEAVQGSKWRKRYPTHTA